MDDPGQEENLPEYKEISRITIYNIMREHNAKTINERLEYAETFLFERENFTESDQMKEFNIKCHNLKYSLNKNGKIRLENLTDLRKCMHYWLQGSFEISNTRRFSSGRPTVSFADCSDRSKRRKTEEIRRNVEVEELLFAAESKLRTTGQRKTAKLVKEITNGFLDKTACNCSINKLPHLEALSMFVEAGLTKKQYEVVRLTNKKFYPCYSVLQKYKKTCYPPSESITVTESLAEIQLQSLLDHTASRLIEYLKDVIQTLTQQERESVLMLVKWGCDGSQQTEFKQKFLDETNSDANIFQCSMVPLQLICTYNKKVIWQNPTPSSPRFCRPIRIRFVKESKDVTKEEINDIEDQIKALISSEIHEHNLKISYSMMFTMVDGKVCLAATDTNSTLKCYICGATSRQFNDINLKFTDNENNYRFGISVLHARIRFFESILHLSYKLPVKKWQQRLSEDETNIIKTRKKQIQEQFKSRMGVLVDVPKSGFGTTNDGNTSRRFFSKPEIAADITGIDLVLIKRLGVILEAISSGFEIDIEKFTAHTQDTAKLYVSLYAWHPMTPTLHKILMHGSSIIKHALLPIGQLSEEAAEARNKHFRSYRLNYARKFTRTQCNQDILNRLLLTSDPLLSSIRQKPVKHLKRFSKEALNLLTFSSPHNMTKDFEDINIGSESELESEHSSDSEEFSDDDDEDVE